MENRLTIDTDLAVYFYEQDHYYLSNFSAFVIYFDGAEWPTSEQAYQAQKFIDDPFKLDKIRRASSAHEAFKLAERWKPFRREDWDEVKIGIMRDIIVAKVHQHEYVHRKLLETGNRSLIENSWRDSFWGWGPNRDGRNELGLIWMDVRDEIRGTGMYAPE